MLRGEERSCTHSVVYCDHEDCGEEYVLGPGEGDSLSSDDLEALQREGWTSDGEHDFCPEHAAGAGRWPDPATARNKGCAGQGLWLPKQATSAQIRPAPGADGFDDEDDYA